MKTGLGLGKLWRSLVVTEVPVHPREKETETRSRMQWICNVLNRRMGWDSVESNPNRRMSVALYDWALNMRRDQTEVMEAESCKRIFQRNTRRTVFQAQANVKERSVEILQATVIARWARLQCRQLSDEVAAEKTAGVESQLSPTLLSPDPVMVTKVVKSLERCPETGRVTTVAAKALFVCLLDISPSAVDENHDEIAAFVRLDTKEMVNQLCMGCEQEKIEEYFEANVAEGSILGSRTPDKRKIERILEATFTRQHVTDLFIHLLDVLPGEISVEHPDVIAFHSLTKAEQTEKLLMAASAKQIDAYYLKEWRDIISPRSRSPSKSA